MSPPNLKNQDKGFPVVTKTMFDTIDATISMVDEKLYFDQI